MELDLFGGLEATISKEIIEHYSEAKTWIEPSYLMEDPYRSLLTAIARGDGKILNAFSRAGLSESVGGADDSGARIALYPSGGCFP